MKGKQFAYSFLGTVIRVVVLVILAILLFKLGGKAYEFGFRIFTEAPMSEPPGRDIQVTVSKSDGIKEVSKMLEEKGLIRDAKLFRIQEKVSMYDGEIHPGIFTLNTSMTAEEMFAVLLESENKDETEEDEEKEKENSSTEAGPVNSPMDEVSPDENAAGEDAGGGDEGDDAAGEDGAGEGTAEEGPAQEAGVAE